MGPKKKYNQLENKIPTNSVLGLKGVVPDMPSEETNEGTVRGVNVQAADWSGWHSLSRAGDNAWSWSGIVAGVSACG